MSVPIQASFEFSPPKNAEAEKTLWQSIERLAPLKPSFVSVTYGAGGSTRELTHATVKRLVNETDLAPAAHLTCVAASKSEVDEVIRSYWDIGVKHIVALRGDPPEGIDAKYEPHPKGYESSTDLVRGIKNIADFEVSVGCYPEKHPQSPSMEQDIEFLKQKVDAGATRAITQLFCEADHYFRFIDRVRKAGIEIPIVPGIMPVTNFKGFQRMATGCGASIPDWFADRYVGLDDDLETRRLVGAMVTADLCMRLYDEGITDFHFYTLNRASLTYAICHVLGLRP